MHALKSIAAIALISFLTTSVANRVSFLRSVMRTDPA